MRSSLMKPVNFSSIHAAVAHPNKETITKLRIKNGVFSMHLLDNLISTSLFSYTRNMVIKIQLLVYFESKQFLTLTISNLIRQF